VAKFSTVRTGNIYPQKKTLVLISVRDYADPTGRGEIGRIKPKRNSNDPIRNGTLDLPACRAVSQSTA